jgi:hypothetical protein
LLIHFSILPQKQNPSCTTSGGSAVYRRGDLSLKIAKIQRVVCGEEWG